MEVLRAKCGFKGIGIPSIADLEPHRADFEAGWIHMLEHQLPALLPVATFRDALPEIFAWLEGAAPQPLAAMPVDVGDTLIRGRIIGLPAGGRGQNYIEMIRFAAANRLLVEIDCRGKQGNRSTRAIEAYSLRRSQAGDVLLRAVRGQRAIAQLFGRRHPWGHNYPDTILAALPDTVWPSERPASGEPEFRRGFRRAPCASYSTFARP